MALSAPYFFGAIIVPLVFGCLPAKVQFIMCFILSSIAFAMMGPSDILDFPDVLWLVLCGMTLLGFAQSLVFIPCMPEAVETFQL